MFSSSQLPAAEEVLLITDQLSSPAEFLLHRSLASHFKDSKDSTCIIVAASESLAKWKAIGGKSNVNVVHHLSSGSLVFLDAASVVQPAFTHDASMTQHLLKPLYDRLQHILGELMHRSVSSPLIIIDDISVLEWIGFSSLDVSRFVRAVCSLSRKADASLIIRHHIVTPGEPDDLTRLLFQLCTYHLEVLPLSTGRSGSVSGQVALHAGPGVTSSAHKLVPRSAAVQYRLTDTSYVFFGRGTGSTVL